MSNTQRIVDAARSVSPPASSLIVRLLRMTDSVAARLVIVVIVTGLIGFGIIGFSTSLRLTEQLGQQARALGDLSEAQIAERLRSETALAQARISQIEASTAMQTRVAARRPDVVAAAQSDNDVVIRETLRRVSENSDLPRLLAADESGLVIGTSWATELLDLNARAKAANLFDGLPHVLKQSTRGRPFTVMRLVPLSNELQQLLRLEVRPMLAHVAIEPMFDDFGETVGALIAIRPLARHEKTLEQFSMLAGSGIVLMHNGRVVSSAGEPNVTFYNGENGVLVRSTEGDHLGRCVTHAAETQICTFTRASHVENARNEMFKIGEEHGRAQMRDFLTWSGFALLIMVGALLVALKRVMRGLAPLASTARAIAAGNLEMPFRASGVGEIRSLGHAFEKMIANLRESTLRIRTLAFFDGVTQLANREKILTDAPGLIEESGQGALFFIDLDGFKAINDSFGHKAGDILLRKVAERLTALLIKDYSNYKTLLARLGGDEFAILVAGLGTDHAATRVATDIIACLRPPVALEGNVATVGASVGIALYPTSARTYDELLVNADLAMYSAKQSGRNTFANFNARLAEDAQAQRVLENDLIEAIESGSLSVYFQPKILCANGEIRGVEALARWFHPTQGTIPPGIFIKLAEQTGLIRDLGRVILKKALVEIGRLLDDGADVILSVNITAVDIEDPKFPAEVIRVLQETGFPPERLELEVTESIAATNANIVGERMNVLRQFGVRFSMDDFGAGYSNLATMARLPFDTLKIDRSLAHGSAGDVERQTILNAAIGLARDLGFDTVVEGVEDPADLTFVVDAGATYVQGYIFSPPVDIENLAVMLDPERMVVGRDNEARNSALHRTAQAG